MTKIRQATIIFDEDLTLQPKERGYRASERSNVRVPGYFDRNALTFSGIRDLLGSALLGGQKLLNTLRLAGHSCDVREAKRQTTRAKRSRIDHMTLELPPSASPYNLQQRFVARCLVISHVVRCSWLLQFFIYDYVIALRALFKLTSLSDSRFRVLIHSISRYCD